MMSRDFFFVKNDKNSHFTLLSKESFLEKLKLKKFKPIVAKDIRYRLIKMLESKVGLIDTRNSINFSTINFK